LKNTVGILERRKIKNVWPYETGGKGSIACMGHIAAFVLIKMFIKIFKNIIKGY